MATETLIFDPDGDLLFILSRVPRDDSDDDSDDDSEDDSSSGDDSVMLSTEEEISEDEEDENDDSQGNVAVPPDSKGMGEVNEVDSTSDEFQGLVLYASSKEDNFFQGKGPDTLVHMLVSSKHMMLVSPVFKAMLQASTFKEGQKLSAAGKVEVPLPEDDPIAFEVVLNIIHGRNKLVPRVLSLDLLTSLSLLVDKYQMAEAVQCFSDTWIGALIEDLPELYPSETKTDSGNVLLWLQVSWVFENDEVFTKMTELLERGCHAYLRKFVDKRLLIPDPIFDAILMHRREALSEMYDLIEKKIERYQGHKVRCRRKDDTELAQQCDSLMLGSLLKSAKKLGIIPVPDYPYGLMSFDELSAKFYCLEINAICDSISRTKIKGAYPEPGHGLKDLIEGKVEALEERLSGLDIQDFKRKGKYFRPLVGV